MLKWKYGAPGPIARLSMPALLAVAFLVLPARCEDYKLPPVVSADKLANSDSHGKERVIIGAEAWGGVEHQNQFRFTYLNHGFMPVRMVVTNNSDSAINLSEARIYLVSPAGERIRAAEEEDVERSATRITGGGVAIPLPVPLPPLNGKPKNKNKNKQIDADFRQFEFHDLTVAPNSTASGFLFFDVSELEDPIAGTSLYIRMVKDHTGAVLENFNIPLQGEKKTIY